MPPLAGDLLATANWVPGGDISGTNTVVPIIAGQTCFKALSSLIGRFIVALNLTATALSTDQRVSLAWLDQTGSRRFAFLCNWTPPVAVIIVESLN